ncbi:MAG: branched-chain amino acid ABC transporter permease [Hyphomicrobiaceae bacterium]|nr:branched-chain amino acid ABC transporter permease [Hyphomicrobiaceae bacterium]
MTKATFQRLAILVLIAGLLAVPIVLPMLGASFWVNVCAEILIWSLLAASVNLLFGYVGLLSFGQALYFGFGMYGVALSIAHWSVGFWTALAIGIAAATVMAVVAGVLAVRLTWHYFAIITVVFSLIFYFAAMSAKPLTGGDDGTPFTLPVLFKWGDFELSLADQTVQYYFIAAMTGLCYLLMARILASPLGVAFRAVRENDRRAALIGINVYLTRLIAFVIAGAVAGLAGAMFAYFGRYASASFMFYHVSGEAVVWAIVGGTASLLGPFFGTAALILFREVVSTIWEHYLLAVGAIAIIVVMFAPRGLAGIWHDVTGRLFGGGAQPDEAPADTTSAAARKA